MTRKLASVFTIVAIIATLAQGCATMTGGPTPPEFQPLMGAWERSGGYSLVISGTGYSGVRYWNGSREVNVERASFAKKDNGALQIVVTLRDAGYPGSRYTLELAPDGRELIGTYFHAPSGNSFPVRFSPKK